MSDEPKLRLPLTPEEQASQAERIVDLRAERDACQMTLGDCLTAGASIAAELAQARAEAAVMAEVLDAVDLSGDTCVVCRMYQEHGHDGDCVLAAALSSDLAAQGRLLLAVVEAAKRVKATRIGLDRILETGDASAVAARKASEARGCLWRTLAALDNRKEPKHDEEDHATEACPAEADDGVGGGG